MKRLIIALGLAVTMSLSAVEWKTTSFLADVTSLVVSNYYLGVTNLTDTRANGTNRIYTIWTNVMGNRVISGVTTNAYGGLVGTNYNLLGDQPFSVLSRPQSQYVWPTNHWQGTAAIVVRFVGVAAGADAAVTFRFLGVPDGVNASTAESFVFAATATGLTELVVKTNLPLSTLNNLMGLRLMDITSADAGADTAVVVKGVGLLQQWP